MQKQGLRLRIDWASSDNSTHIDVYDESRFENASSEYLEKVFYEIIEAISSGKKCFFIDLKDAKIMYKTEKIESVLLYYGKIEHN